MAFKCPNCGGHLFYDIGEKTLKCESCDSSVPLGKIERLERAEEHSDTMGIVSFVCQSCGAELLSPEESMVSYCSYCGSEAVLEGRLDREIRPRYIMPFQKTKDACKDAYTKRTKGLFYLPKELKSSEYLEKFRGTYIPYWLYRVDFPEPATFRTVKKTQSGSMITRTTYDVTAKIDGDYRGVPYDASSCFDDTISDMLMPFDKKNLKDFNPGYLAGFYADRADVPAEKYYMDASKRASSNMYTSIGSSLKKSHKMDIDPLSEVESSSAARAEIRESYTALFPIWFLTWRNKKRVAYAIMNGQSGQLSCDLPVDMKQYSLWTLITGAIIFLLLTLFVSMTAIQGLMFCSLLTLTVSLLFNREVREIRDRENHVFDKGYFVKGREVKMPERKREREYLRSQGSKFAAINNLRTSDGVKIIVYILGVILFVFCMWEDEISPATALLGGSFYYAVLGTVLAFSSAKSLVYVKEKTLILLNLFLWAGIICAFAIALWSPVHDYYYYFGCIACGVATAIGSIGLIKYYNLLTTRPIPSFFDREGGRDNAKN